MNLSDVLNETIFGISTWKIIILIGFILISFLVRRLLLSVFNKIKKSIPSTRAKSFWSYWRDLKIDKPSVEILWSLLALFIVHALVLPPTLEKYLAIVLQINLSFHIIKLVYISVDALGLMMKDWAAKTETTLDDQLAPFAIKTLKVLSIVLGVLIAMQNFGINVMSILAGLGLGGLALALAAQDTAANLFGSITILFDNPFKVGDHIKVGDSEGIVEEIGFRSTRIRTPYNSLVTIPNSTVAKEKIDNLGERHSRRIRQILGVHYDTPVEKIMQFCEGIRYIILQEEKVHRDTVTVHFYNYNASSLDILVSFHLTTKDGVEEFKRQEAIFCDILNLSKKMGVEFAYPTQTVYLQKSPSLI